MQLLVHKPSGAALLVSTTHLFWDPHYPHIKACQAELACIAVRRFLSERSQPTSFVLCGDFNSVCLKIQLSVSLYL